MLLLDPAWQSRAYDIYYTLRLLFHATYYIRWPPFHFHFHDHCLLSARCQKVTMPLIITLVVIAAIVVTRLGRWRRHIITPRLRHRLPSITLLLFAFRRCRYWFTYLLLPLCRRHAVMLMLTVYFAFRFTEFDTLSSYACYASFPPSPRSPGCFLRHCPPHYQIQAR